MLKAGMQLSMDLNPMMSVLNVVKGKRAPKRTKRKFHVLAIVRHTRAGDVLRGLRMYRDEQDRQNALETAQEIARESEALYGDGSTSVYKAMLTLAPKPEKE